MNRVASEQLQPEIDVGIPFIGGVELLDETIQSVVKQRYSKWRLTVLDNSTTFESQLLHNKFIADPRIKFVRLDEKYGMAANWNNCLKSAIGQYAIICHSDDLWEEDFLTEISTLIREDPTAEGYFVSAYAIDIAGNRRFSLIDSYKHFITRRQSNHYSLAEQDGIQLLAKGNFIFCSGFCFRRQGDSFPIFDEAWSFVPDYKMSMDLLLDGGVLRGSRQKLVKYRRHPKQATVALEKTFSRFEEEAVFYDWLTSVGQSKSWKKVVCVSKLRLALRLHILLAASKSLLRLDVKTSWYYLKLSVHRFRDSL